RRGHRMKPVTPKMSTHLPAGSRGALPPGESRMPPSCTEPRHLDWTLGTCAGQVRTGASPIATAAREARVADGERPQARPTGSRHRRSATAPPCLVDQAQYLPHTAVTPGSRAHPPKEEKNEIRPDRRGRPRSVATIRKGQAPLRQRRRIGDLRLRHEEAVQQGPRQVEEDEALRRAQVTVEP